jgi:transaldolase
MCILKETTMRYPTKFWNDSCDLKELDIAILNNCAGATTNPIIVKEVIERNLKVYEEFILGIVDSSPMLTEDEVTWLIIEKLAIDAAKKLVSAFDTKTGRGRISIQTNTKYYRNEDLLIKQALYFSTLAPNIQVKIPATSAGIKAIEEVTYRGVSINATVCFGVSQAVQVAEAVERALRRRESENMSNDAINPVCTIMVGRLDDYIKKVIKAEDRLMSPEALEWAGIACAKKYYNIYKERKYKTKLLTAAFRNIHHWTSLVGGDLIATIPMSYQVKINGSNVIIGSMIDEPVKQEYLDELLSIPEFVKAYDETGMSIAEFDRYGAVIDTLSQFFAGYDDLVKIIRKYILR